MQLILQLMCKGFCSLEVTGRFDCTSRYDTRLFSGGVKTSSWLKERRIFTHNFHAQTVLEVNEIFVQFHCLTEFVTKRLLSKRLCTETTGFPPWIHYKKIVSPHRIKVKFYSTLRQPLVVLRAGVNSHWFFDPILKMKILWLNMKTTIWSK